MKLCTEVVTNGRGAEVQFANSTKTKKPPDRHPTDPDGHRFSNPSFSPAIHITLHQIITNNPRNIGHSGPLGKSGKTQGQLRAKGRRANGGIFLAY
jgi:hypothetical protein